MKTFKNLITWLFFKYCADDVEVIINAEIEKQIKNQRPTKFFEFKDNILK